MNGTGSGSRKVLLLLLGIAALTWLIFSATNKAAPSGETSLTLDTASRLAQFVDASLDETTKTYDLFFRCSAIQKTCATVIDPSRPPHMGYATMSLDHVGRAMNDDRLVNKAKKLIDQSVENCEKDARYCEWNFFPLHYYAKTTGDARYRASMLKVADTIMGDRPMRELVGNNLPVKLWLLYDVTKDETYRERLTELADEQLAVYPRDRQNDDIVYSYEGGDVRAYDIPIIWSLYLPAYKATGDAKYLKPTTDFFDATRLEDNVDKFWSISATGDLVKAIEALLDIAEADSARHDAYRAKAQTIVDILLKERWDTPENVLVNGDNGLLVSPTEKATNIQGWLIHSVLELADIETGHHY